MIHSAIDDEAKDASTVGAPVSDTHRGAPLPRTFRGVRAEAMMGIFADIMD